MGGVATIFAVIGIVTFVQRRRRRSGPRPILPTDSVNTGPQMAVSPFDPISFDANQDSGISAEQQPLVIGDAEVATVALQRLSPSPPAVLPFLRQGAHVPVGLSDKEIARLRAETLSLPQSHNLRVLALNSSQSLNVVTGSGESSYDTRRLHSEFETLRREVELLRAEGSVVTAPPSYVEGDR